MLFNFLMWEKSEITKEEFSSGLKKLKIVMNDRETDLVFKYLDSNNDNLLKYNDFCLLMKNKLQTQFPYSENQKNL